MKSDRPIVTLAASRPRIVAAMCALAITTLHTTDAAADIRSQPTAELAAEQIYNLSDEQRQLKKLTEEEMDARRGLGRKTN